MERKKEGKMRKQYFGGERDKGMNDHCIWAAIAFMPMITLKEFYLRYGILIDLSPFPY